MVFGLVIVISSFIQRPLQDKAFLKSIGSFDFFLVTCVHFITIFDMYNIFSQ